MAWFLNTKLGRGIATAAAALAFAVVVYWRVFTAGRKAERTVQDQQSIRNYQTRQEVHNDIATRPVDSRRSDLGRWVQPD